MGDEATAERKLRTDGAQARERILSAALKLFVAQGYHVASVRDIATEAGVNSAAIRYYFGDKAGLYKAALYEPVQHHFEDDSEPFDEPGLALEEALRRYTRKRLLPLAGGEDILLSVRLRMRESFEPTGLLEDGQRFKAELEQRFANTVMRALAIEQPDREFQSLLFSLRGLTAYVYLGRDHLCKTGADLFDSPEALEGWVTRLASYACAMVEQERARRRAPPSPGN
ncbi:CerR family C-terminal domain-containing protein [Oxalobacteraceae bacterium A2-2]